MECVQIKPRCVLKLPITCNATNCSCFFLQFIGKDFSSKINILLTSQSKLPHYFLSLLSHNRQNVVHQLQYVLTTISILPCRHGNVVHILAASNITSNSVTLSRKCNRFHLKVMLLVHSTTQLMFSCQYSHYIIKCVFSLFLLILLAILVTFNMM